MMDIGDIIEEAMKKALKEIGEVNIYSPLLLNEG